jgi:hypothetical protein
MANEGFEMVTAVTASDPLGSEFLESPRDTGESKMPSDMARIIRT